MPIMRRQPRKPNSLSFVMLLQIAAWHLFMLAASVGARAVGIYDSGKNYLPD